jgi:hypothetical protein
MKIAALIIVRDEETYIEFNIKYHLALGFDFMFITNHCSEDNTNQILRKYESNPKIILLNEFDPVFDHGKITNILLQKALSSFEIDWFFLIDADEFLGIPADVHSFVQSLEERKIVYASIGWANALFYDEQKASSPIDTDIFYIPYPERDWQHQGHFRKSIAKNHKGIEIVVGGHYFKSENNQEFFELSGGKPFLVPFEEAKYFHFELRNNPINLLKKWANLANNEKDSSSRANAPWLERINLIRSYVKDYKNRPDEVQRLWFVEHRTLWGKEIPKERIFKDNTLKNWNKLNVITNLNTE